jgi:hypothetical protein
LGRDEPSTDYWTVHIAVPDSVAAFRDGAALTQPSEHHAVVTESRPEGDGDTIFVVDVLATDEDDAIARASDAYRQARDRAGLPRTPVLVLGLVSPAFKPHLWVRLREEAGRLLDNDRPELAVVRAQTACELRANEALDGAFRAEFSPERAAAALRQCRSALNDRRTQDVLFAITGYRITAEPWWASYVAHVQRRHGVVHEGLLVSPDGAASSLAAVDHCIGWLQALWGGLLPAP